MNLFQFSPEEILTFFVVLVRMSVMIAVLPFVGDRFVPGPAKILLSFALCLALYPTWVAGGHIRPADARVWGATAGGIIGTVGIEVMFGLAMGYVAKLLFDAINIGANLAGNFMGLAAASTYDPHQETQTQVVAEVQMAIAMLLFLALDGHHLMFGSALRSYEIVGLGEAGITQAFSQTLIDFTGKVLSFAVQISAPVAISLFSVHMVFGIFAKAIPQMNVLVISFAVTVFLGIVVMLISMPAFSNAVAQIFGEINTWMFTAMRAMVDG